MINTKLKALKEKSNLTSKDISERSGVPYSTVQKIFNGDTANPNSEAVYQIVKAMGFKVEDIYKEENSPEGEESMTAVITAIKEAYESRITDLKESHTKDKESQEKHIASLTRDKRVLAVAVGVLGVFILGVLIFDLLHGGVGYVRY